MGVYYIVIHIKLSLNEYLCIGLSNEKCKE